MKTFDMHADIGTNFIERHLDKEVDIYRKYNHDNISKGDIKGIFTACWFSGNETWDYTKQMVEFTNEEISRNSDVLRQVKSKEDLIIDEKVLALISVEGMCGVDSDVENKIQWLYDHGVRVASLVWNEVNHLASGWPNDPLVGLSEDGFKVVKKMNEIGMIIDVSHINEKGFWDIISSSNKPIIATHSNSRVLCPHDRNLTDQQIKAIGEKGGLIGLNAAGAFIDTDRNKQTSYTLALHGKHISDLIGVEHIACGFDYMNFLKDYSGDSNMALDLANASYTQNLVKSLLEVGFNENEVEMIMYYNVFNFLKGTLWVLVNLKKYLKNNSKMI